MFRMKTRSSRAKRLKYSFSIGKIKFARRRIHVCVCVCVFIVFSKWRRLNQAITKYAFFLYFAGAGPRAITAGKLLNTRQYTYIHVRYKHNILMNIVLTRIPVCARRFFMTQFTYCDYIVTNVCLCVFMRRVIRYTFRFRRVISLRLLRDLQKR